MSYGIQQSIDKKNKKYNKKAWAVHHASKKTKHFVNINGRDVEVPSPNSFSVSKPVWQAINPILI